jgi:hypothetical protein
VGLAKRLSFYRPERHPKDSVRGIWESHQAVARHALAAGHGVVAVFEDDLRFTGSLKPGKLKRIARALQDLPPDWQIFFLGHWPLRCSFIKPDVLRTRSGCAHAYIANRRTLEWIAATDFDAFRKEHPEPSAVGRGIDDAFYRLPGAYAIFPMIAIQSPSPGDHVRPKNRGNFGRFRHLVTRTRLREWGLSLMMRPNEWRAVSVAAARAAVRAPGMAIAVLAARRRG